MYKLHDHSDVITVMQACEPVELSQLGGVEYVNGRMAEQMKWDYI